MENKTIWLKNTKNGLLFEIAESDLFLYPTPIFVEAGASEVKDYQGGTYWEKREADEKATTVVSTPVKKEAEAEAPVVPNLEPESKDPLDLKTKKELLEILLNLDPQSTFDDRTVKAEIIEGIKVFQSIEAPVNPE